MPKYSYNVEKFVVDLLEMPEDERLKLIRKMYNVLEKKKEKVAFALLYLYGMRPEELIKLKRNNFEIYDEFVRLRLPTVKRGVDRIIDLDIKDTPFMNDIIEYVKSVEWKLFPTWNDPTAINNTVFKRIKDKLGINISPYAFRHYRLSYIAYLGAELMDLIVWKGAKDLRSVIKYLAKRPVRKFRRSIK